MGLLSAVFSGLNFLMQPICSAYSERCSCAPTGARGWWLMLAAVLVFGSAAAASGQALPAAPAAPQMNGTTFQGSVPEGKATTEPINLTLDDAIQRGLRNNLGVILSGKQTATVKAERLSQLQSLLPDVEGSIREADMQVDLAAEGLRIPGFPTVVGPFGFTDIRASLAWSLVNVKSLRSYLAA